MHLPALLIIASFLAVTSVAPAQTARLDIEYAQAGDVPLKLDLHLPRQPQPPLIVYVHGGAWRAGSKSDVPIAGLLGHGFAIASVDYRLSTQARFPAQIHDIKAAIRFLRAKAAKLGVDAKKIAIIGSSAGGHLAALAGVTNGHAGLEGKIGGHLGQSSDAQCIVSFYGAANLQSILSQSTAHGLRVRVPALQLLLGGQPKDVPALAKLASPVAHLDNNDPPLLLIHGDADPQMPPEQSHEFVRSCQAAQAPVQLVILPGSQHGGEEFYNDERIKLVAGFLRKALCGP